MSPTTSQTRCTVERYGACYADTLSACSPTRSTSGRGTGGPRSASLRESLRCLAQAIEQLSYSYRTFNTSFSWTLALNASPYGERSTESRSSTAGTHAEKPGREEEKTIEAPMIILDELGVCEQRAKAILEYGPATGLPGMLDGRKQHIIKNLQAIARRAARSLREKGFTILSIMAEKPLPPLRLEAGRKTIVLKGRPDLVILAATPRNQLAVINIEYTTYTTAPRTIMERHVLYAYSLYTHYGFPVVPAVLIDTGREARTYILVKQDETRLENHLRSRLNRLAQLAEEDKARPPKSREACHTCPLPIRMRCPYHEA